MGFVFNIQTKCAVIQALQTLSLSSYLNLSFYKYVHKMAPLVNFKTNTILPATLHSRRLM